ncbi:hypothetical protein LINPERHAP2_LOCUS20484 [Linum perenne]
MHVFCFHIPAQLRDKLCPRKPQVSFLDMLSLGIDAYCLFKGGRKRLWDHLTFIAFQSYSNFARNMKRKSS